MNGNKLLDTNILIYLTKGELILDSFSNQNDNLSISAITYMEALGYNFKSASEEELMKSLCKNLNLIHLNTEIIDLVIGLRKTCKINLPDAIIAATAIQGNYTLITRNVNDFIGVKGKIKIIDPQKR